ncbi:hypothetical protein [Auraticoccus monumenti]|uniref:Uncharacterized protein n=1 Tax=Auraticoccus monumenti TaxID=675864 RepID=A0A1G6YTT4_9ACTN|nr:hypothetical protein [Auraticoccus monumenti]SDD93057.1 hypothetical protein SAMN04489747_2081 [Auraticoccus monumenti]
MDTALLDPEVTQTSEVADRADDVGPSTPVPTCRRWTLIDLENRIEDHPSLTSGHGGAA